MPAAVSTEVYTLYSMHVDLKFSPKKKKRLKIIPAINRMIEKYQTNKTKMPIENLM